MYYFLRGVVIRYLLLVLQMTSCFYIMALYGASCEYLALIERDDITAEIPTKFCRMMKTTNSLCAAHWGKVCYDSCMHMYAICHTLIY